MTIEQSAAVKVASEVMHSIARYVPSAKLITCESQLSGESVYIKVDIQESGVTLKMMDEIRKILDNARVYIGFSDWLIAITNDGETTEVMESDLELPGV